MSRLLHVALAAALLVAGCSARHGVYPPNLRPHVALTDGPVARTTASYTIPLSWRGWDDDGVIDHFLYTIDTIDTTWTRTTAHETVASFTATSRADSTHFADWHTFYVKAVDDKGAESEPATLTFNASTIAPQTHPVKPVQLASGNGINSPLSGGPTLRLEWSGEDPDGVHTLVPVGYEVVRVPLTRNIAGDWDAARALCTGATAQVQRLGRVSTLSFADLAPSGRGTNWMFWVRAIDEAGAVEPWPSRSGVWPSFFFFYFALPNVQGPALTLNSYAFGRFDVQGADRDSFDYAFDAPFNVTFTADASNYGGDIDGFRWGVDLADIDNPRDPGWATGWTRGLRGVSGLVFHDRDAPIHDLVIQARDTNGAISTATLRITLVPFDFDRDVLLVDDEWELYATGSAPTSSQHVQYMTDRLRGALGALGRPARVDVYSTFPDSTMPSSKPVRLATLGHYRAVVWDAGRPPFQNTLFAMSAVSASSGITRVNPLATYLEAGGRLIVSGLGNARSTVTAVPATGRNIGAGQGLAPGLGNFAIEYWHLPATVWFGRDNPTINGLLACEPTAWSRAHGGFPRLSFDIDRFWVIAASGPSGSEALDAIRPPSLRGAGDFVEPLYSYVSAGGDLGPKSTSYLHGLVNAQWFKKAPRREDEDWQYEVAWFGFPLYAMRPDGVEGALTELLRGMLGDRRWRGAAVTRPPAAPTNPSAS